MKISIPFTLTTLLLLLAPTLQRTSLQWQDPSNPETEPLRDLKFRNNVLQLTHQDQIKQASLIFPLMVVKLNGNSDCPHTKKFSPIYERLANKWIHRGIAVQFAEISMDHADRYDNSFHIGHTPGLLFFKHGEGSLLLYKLKYKQWRKVLLTKINAFIDKLHTKTQIGELKQKHQKFLAFYGTSHRNLRIFQSLANLYPDLRHYVGSSEELMDQAGSEKIVFYDEKNNAKHEFSMAPAGYSFEGNNHGFSQIDPIKYYNFMTEHYFDKVMKFDNPQVLNRVLTKQLTCVWLFYDAEESGNIKRKFYELGNKENSLKTQIHFVEAEATGDYVSNYLPMLNFGSHKQPFVLVTEPANKGHSVKRYLYDGSMEAEKFKSDLENWLTRLDTNLITSLPISEEIKGDVEDAEHLVRLVGDNFGDFVRASHNEKTLVVQVYKTEECFLCFKAYDAYYDLALSFNKNFGTQNVIKENDVIFGIYDAYLNHPRPEFTIPGYPEILIFPRYKKDELVQYGMNDEKANEKDIGEWLNWELVKIQDQRPESDL